MNSSLSEWLQPMGLLFSVSLLELILQVQTAHHNSIGKLHYCPYFLLTESCPLLMVIALQSVLASARFDHLKQLIEPGTVTLVILELFHLSGSFGGQRKLHVTFCNKLFKF